MREFSGGTALMICIRARLKSCPDTKHFSKLARNRLTRTLVLQSFIAPFITGYSCLPTNIAFGNLRFSPAHLPPVCSQAAEFAKPGSHPNTSALISYNEASDGFGEIECHTW